MNEFVLRVASKRQVTFPDDLLAALDLKQGDEFGVQFVSPFDVRLVPYSRIRRALMTPEVQEALRKSEAAFNSPETKWISLEDLDKRIAAKKRLVGKTEVRSEAEPRNVGRARVVSRARAKVK